MMDMQHFVFGLCIGVVAYCAARCLTGPDKPFETFGISIALIMIFHSFSAVLRA